MVRGVLTAGLLALLLVSSTASAGTPGRTTIRLEAPASATEGSVLRVKVRLSRRAPRPVRLAYATVDGIATAGRDYAGRRGTLRIRRGRRAASFRIRLLDDLVPESVETFKVRVRVRRGLRGVRAVKMRLRIVDVPPAPAPSPAPVPTATPPPTVSIADVSVGEGNDPVDQATGQVHPATPVVLTLRRTSPAPAEGTVRWATADGTALASATALAGDYAASSGTATFAPGATETTIQVPVIRDFLEESDETFDVVLSAAEALLIGDDRATVTITNDDQVCPPGEGADTTEPNDQFGTAPPYLISGAVQQESVCWGDADYYSISAPAQKRLAILPDTNISGIAPLISLFRVEDLGIAPFTAVGRLVHWGGLSYVVVHHNQSEEQQDYVVAYEAPEGDPIAYKNGESELLDACPADEDPALAVSAVIDTPTQDSVPQVCVRHFEVMVPAGEEATATVEIQTNGHHPHDLLVTGLPPDGTAPQVSDAPDSGAEVVQWHNDGLVERRWVFSVLDKHVLGPTPITVTVTSAPPVGG